MTNTTPREDRPEHLEDYCPGLTFEEIKSYDDVLEDYLDLCMEIYWQRVEDGTFPSPHSDDELDPDSTIIE